MVFFAFALGCGNGTEIFPPPPPPPPPPPTGISISPATVNLFVNQTTQFDAQLQGTSRQEVTWSIEEDNGGNVSSGLYRAPSTVGTYHLTATAVADVTKTATATITVSAVTAFLEALPGGTSTPWSVTPILMTLHADGTLETAPILDPNTNLPMDTSLYDVFLSADGAKLVGSTPLSDAQGNVAWNVVIFNSDGSGMTTLTNNVPVSQPNYPTVSGDRSPQLSPDGKFIVYYRRDIVGTLESQIWLMNADGSKPHILQSTICPSLPAPDHCVEQLSEDPSFSPDGSRIVYHYWERLDQSYARLGIATANADGTGTPDYLTTCIALAGSCDTWDSMPAFTNDGSKITFTRRNAGTAAYIMPADGSNLPPLYDPRVAGSIAFQARAFADRILFSSNVNNPGTNAFEIYSIMPDGSNLTRLTNNTLYDGFSVAWMNYPAQTSMEHLKMSGIR